METTNLIRYEMNTYHELEDFAEMIHSIELKYTTRHLLLIGLTNEDIQAGINRGMNVCGLNGIDSGDHFRSVYIFDEKTSRIYCDWRMTRQGFTLVIMNTPASNPAIAHWQWELINSSTAIP